MEDHPKEKKRSFFSTMKEKFSSKNKKSDEEVTEEIKDIVQESHEAGVIEENAVEMINNIIDLGEKTASDVMVHRKNIYAIDGNVSLEDAFKLILEATFSRYPVYDGDIDNIVGIFHMREIIKAYSVEENRTKTLLELKDVILLDDYVIPETRMVSRIFKDMQRRKIHMAIVVDEYGQTAGLITMEDVLEEIVGNIWDEHDNPVMFITKQYDGSYILEGEAELAEVSRILGISFGEEDIDTVNGFMTLMLGHIPDEDESFSFEYKGYIFEIVKVSNRVISETRVTKVEQPGV